MPTSMTTAPGLIHDPLTYSAFPIAETRISAFLTWGTVNIKVIGEWQWTDNVLNILRPAMALSYSGICVAQHGGNRTADNIATTENYSI